MSNKQTPHKGMSEYVYQHAYPSAQVALNCNLLLDAAYKIDNQQSTDDCPVLSFTGGWVRDKLLWLESTDIDVGINNITGYDFATRRFHFSKVNLNQYGHEPGEVTKIESNSEKSKHLVTARMQIGGLDIDLVNRRKESHSGYGRIPHMVCSPLPSTLFFGGGP